MLIFVTYAIIVCARTLLFIFNKTANIFNKTAKVKGENL